MQITFQEYQPSGVLAGLVDGYWFAACAGEGGLCSPVQTCLPHGMIELVVHLSPQRSYGYLDGEWRPFPQAYFVGIMERAIHWRMETGTAMFGIRLHPEHLPLDFGLSVAHLNNTFYEADVGGNAAYSTLIRQLPRLDNNADRLLATEIFLQQQVQLVTPVSSHLTNALALIRNGAFYGSVDELSRRLCISERQLQRAFKAHFGLGPKVYIRIMRFHRIYRYLKANPKASWPAIAFDYGYADQAHFIRDFKAFAGNTPKQVALSRA